MLLYINICTQKKEQENRDSQYSFKCLHQVTVASELVSDLGHHPVHDRIREAFAQKRDILPGSGERNHRPTQVPGGTSGQEPRGECGWGAPRQCKTVAQ